TFQHRAGVSPYTSPFGLAETCVFDKQSLGPSHCGSYLYEHPFSRSYGVILPSSLTRVRSLTLEFSSQLPVSVYGTGGIYLASSFSWQCESTASPTKFQLPVTTHGYTGRICLPRPLVAWTCTSFRMPDHPPASPLHSNDIHRYRNFCLSSIAYASSPRLRSRLTQSGRAFLWKP